MWLYVRICSNPLLEVSKGFLSKDREEKLYILVLIELQSCIYNLLLHICKNTWWILTLNPRHFQVQSSQRQQCSGLQFNCYTEGKRKAAEFQSPNQVIKNLLHVPWLQAFGKSYFCGGWCPDSITSREISLSTMKVHHKVHQQYSKLQNSKTMLRVFCLLSRENCWAPIDLWIQAIVPQKHNHSQILCWWIQV